MIFCPNARRNPRAALLASVLALSLLAGCNDDGTFDSFRKDDPFDRQQNLTRDDYRDINRAEKLLPNEAVSSVALGAPPIPDVAQVIAAPMPPKVGNTKRVSIAVTDDVPLRDVLFELGRLANVDIEIGPGLDTRGVNLRAQDRPFNEVIERIADLAGLRYSVKNGALRVEEDTPYVKNYSIDFLNAERSGTSTISVQSNVLSSSVTGGDSGGSSGGSSSGSSGGSSSGVTSGASASINTTAASDLWASLASSITEILNSGVAATVTVSTDSAGGASAASSAAPASTGNFVINKQAGVLSVNATERQHDRLAIFLEMLRRNASAQVLLEAKIVEVALNDEFQSGIDWTHVIGDLGKTNVRLGTFTPSAISGSDLSFSTNGAISLSVEGGDLDAVLQLTQRFGATRTLSSPRLHAINNQQAVATFAQNRIVQLCDLEEAGSSTTGDAGATTSTGPTVTCTVSTLPIGIVLNILPSINLDTQEVTLNVRPTLSRQVDQQESIGTRIAAAAVAATANANTSGTVNGITENLQSFIPVVEVREIDSVMKIKSGSVMVIGGLMEEVGDNEEKGIPVLSSIPWVGNAFKSNSEGSSKRELIIFIKATVVNSSGSASGIDRGVYEKYTTDPRPLF